jgi:hypothetical protein
MFIFYGSIMILVILFQIRGDLLKDVLNQIILIDKNAFENQEKNENELFRIKQTYEETINIYKKEKLNNAKQNAEAIAKKIDSALKSEEEKQKITIGKISEEIDKQYKNSEKMLIEKLFSELFALEG